MILGLPCLKMFKKTRNILWWNIFGCDTVRHRDLNVLGLYHSARNIPWAFLRSSHYLHSIGTILSNLENLKKIHTNRSDARLLFFSRWQNMSKCWWFWETQKGTIPDAVWNIYSTYVLACRGQKRALPKITRNAVLSKSPKNVALVKALSAKDDKSM